MFIQVQCDTYKRFCVITLTQAEYMIGNQTYSHMQFTKKNRKDFKEELGRINEVIEEITGVEVKYVWLPYGSRD